jgi:hypothetical protein
MFLAIDSSKQDLTWIYFDKNFNDHLSHNEPEFKDNRRA